MRTIIVGVLLFCAACQGKRPSEKASGENIYTLYRSGAVISSVRIHVATFETVGENIDWNMNNCEQVARLLNEAKKTEQYPVRFWCEKGPYKE